MCKVIISALIHIDQINVKGEPMEKYHLTLQFPSALGVIGCTLLFGSLCHLSSVLFPAAAGCFSKESTLDLQYIHGGQKHDSISVLLFFGSADSVNRLVSYVNVVFTSCSPAQM